MVDLCLKQVLKTELGKLLKKLKISYKLQLNTPILFLTYKRFETSEKVFKSIKNAKPQKLYFVSNAPKSNEIEEIEKVLKVRSLVNLIDWECEVITLFRDIHLDVKESITSSIDWFFLKEEKGIILEVLEDVVS